MKRVIAETLTSAAAVVALKLEHRAARSNAMHLVSATPDAMICATSAGAVTFWNAGAEQMLGYSAAEVMGRRAFAIVAPDDRRLLVDSLSALHGSTTCAEGCASSCASSPVLQVQARRKDGSSFAGCVRC